MCALPSEVKGNVHGTTGQPVIKGLDAVRRVVENRTGPRRTTTWDIRVWMARSSRSVWMILWMKAGTIVRARLCCALRST